MSSAALLGMVLCLVSGLALAEAAPPPVPDTPAGHALASWLSAFNSGDRATLNAFDQAHAPWIPLDTQVETRRQTGGYDLLSIEASGTLWIVFHVKGRASPAHLSGSLVVRPNEPEHLSLLHLSATDARSQEIVLDEAARRRIVQSAATLIEKNYVFPAVGKKTAARLQAQQKQGDYRGITDGQVFAVRLSDDLTALSGDRHFGVDYFAKEMPSDEPRPRPPVDRKRLAARNCGFEKADHYPPNIGYLKLNEFAEPEACASTAIAAMNLLADSDVLIIDLRDNVGGAPRMAALISSYLFEGPTHLDDLYDRTQNTTEPQWTSPSVPGKKFSGKAVYVLTAHRTFSAAEEFSFDLQALQRATLIGEVTGGGAHTMAPFRIDGHFFVRVPFGRFINPITSGDWEGKGVEPDVQVPAADALEEALRRVRATP